MDLWADYVGYPGGAALVANGFTGAIRYVGIGGAAKRMTASEYQDLKSHGLKVLAVVESTTTEADNGYAAGVADARAALADLNNLGAADIPFIFATNDKTTYVPADLEYVRGFRDTLGVQRTGAYGFGDFLSAVKQLGYASAYWQAGYPPSKTNTSSFVHFWQRQGTAGIAADGASVPVTRVAGGISCDINNQLLPLPTWSKEMGLSSGAFEHGVTRHSLPIETDSTSTVIKDLWFSVRPAWGNLNAVHIFFLDDKGDDMGNLTIDNILSNHRWFVKAPNGATGVNIDWTEQPDSNVDHPSVGWLFAYTSK